MLQQETQEFLFFTFAKSVRFASFLSLSVPVVPAGGSLVYRWRDGHTVETIFVVVSLIELLPNLPDVGGNNHKVPMGEANQNIPVTIPGRDTQRKRINLSTNISGSYFHNSFGQCVMMFSTSGRTQCVRNDAGRSILSGFQGPKH